jgi:hypothetical protein
MDWVRWHQEYEDVGSSLARRRRVVQRNLRTALSEVAADRDGEMRLISICAGDGGDVLPVLAGRPFIRALLVELDRQLSDRARRTAAEFGLSRVEIRTADAGATDVLLDFVPAHVVLACGVFGNITFDDARRTITTLPQLLAPGGIVIWTRGRADDGTDPSVRLCDVFSDLGFTRLSLTAPGDARFRVGMHRLDTAAADPPPPGTRMFGFVGTGEAGGLGCRG